MIHNYIIDLETTGVKTNWHEVTQITIIRCSDRNQLNKYIWPKFPDRTSPDALKYTGRTMQDLYKGEPAEDVVKACHEFILQDGAQPEGRCIIGHNILSFDKRFLHALWEECDLVFPANLWLDTIRYFRAYLKKKGIKDRKTNLNHALEVLGKKPRPGAHNAIVDTQNNYILWNALKKEGVPNISLIKREAHCKS
jgi:DNA polymerase III epsilon subunit-like protein